MKTRCCETCDGPVIILGGEKLQVDCVACRSKPEHLCRAPGCDVALPRRLQLDAFCLVHYLTAFRCSVAGCRVRLPANSLTRLCSLHERRRRTA